MFTSEKDQPKSNSLDTKLLFLWVFFFFLNVDEEDKLNLRRKSQSNEMASAQVQEHLRLKHFAKKLLPAIVGEKTTNLCQYFNV